MADHQAALMVTFLLYLIGLLTLGYLGERKYSKSYDEFVSAGKSLGAWVTALSAAASAESAWVMLGLSGLGYSNGLAAYWASIGCVLGFMVNWKFVVAPVRRLSGEHGSLTMSDMIEDVLHDRKQMLRIIGSIVIVFFMGCYVVSQFVGAGKTLNGMGMMDYQTGVLIGSLIIGAYVLMGGYAAVCWTDALQGALMALIMIVLPVLAVFHAGGFGSMVSELEQAGLQGFFSLKGAGLWGSLGFIFGQLGIGLGYQGGTAIRDDCHLVGRIRAVRGGDIGHRRTGAVPGSVGCGACASPVCGGLSPSGNRWGGAGGHYGCHHVHGGFPADVCGDFTGQ